MNKKGFTIPIALITFIVLTSVIIHYATTMYFNAYHKKSIERSYQNYIIEKIILNHLKYHLKNNSLKNDSFSLYEGTISYEVSSSSSETNIIVSVVYQDLDYHINIVLSNDSQQVLQYNYK